MKTEKVVLDPKGRVLIPSSFRDSLSLRSGDSIFLALDEKSNSLILSVTPAEPIFLLDIEMSDAPGTLANLAKVMAERKVDLITTESHSLVRTKKAVWRVMCKLETKEIPSLTSELKKNGALHVSCRKL
ncbi:hypothetical protein HZC07_00980 [Candidatus Micrarchaeota archaeon]|nr:hypothetical protein [Candidatus Micrarchaeota archaeon]